MCCLPLIIPGRSLQLIHLEPCTRAHVIPQQFARAPWTLSWSFYNSGTRMLRFRFVSGRAFRGCGKTRLSEGYGLGAVT